MYALIFILLYLYTYMYMYSVVNCAYVQFSSTLNIGMAVASCRNVWLEWKGHGNYICIYHSLRCASLLSLTLSLSLSLSLSLWCLIYTFIFFCSFLAEAGYLFLICNSQCNYSCTRNYITFLVHTQKAEKQGGVVSGGPAQRRTTRFMIPFPLLMIIMLAIM